MSEDNWKLLTVTRGGTVSLIKGLTKEKSEELAESLLCNSAKYLRDLSGQYNEEAGNRQKQGLGPELFSGGSGSCFVCSDNDIIRAEAFE